MTNPPPAIGLRVPTEEDAYAWHQAFNDAEVMEFLGGKPAERSVYEEMTARQRRHDAEHGFCFWTLTDARGEVLGFTGAQPWPHDWSPAVGQIEIGWRLTRAAWGRGYVTAAARETLERVRSAGVEEVVALVDAANHRSSAVARRLGMGGPEEFLTPSGRAAYCYRLKL